MTGYGLAVMPCGIAEQPEYAKNYIENNQDIIEKYESYSHECKQPLQPRDGIFII